MNSAALISASPPISPIRTMPSVSGSSSNNGSKSVEWFRWRVASYTNMLTDRDRLEWFEQQPHKLGSRFRNNPILPAFLNMTGHNSILCPGLIIPGQFGPIKRLLIFLKLFLPGSCQNKNTFSYTNNQWNFTINSF